ncbi:DUF3090 domain-containing protein [Nocardioides daejeonensis]|uniref:DUF3090 domain-containing protein n=1 Tax=Nocardioides daejeonensis TaxID=1046556 RepID=UPI000D749981|nr:DUF3090 domain-containing protein [Nocardioides daejeonensis]
MAPIVHSFDPPDRFVAGTVGQPGQREFFLQAREGRRVASVSLEKQQVAVLASRIDDLLDDLMGSAETATVIPALAPRDLLDSDPLEQPIAAEFRGGTMTLSWDAADERIVIEVFPFDEAELEGLEEQEPAEVFLVRMSAGMARAFVKRAETVVSSGRPPCPFCGGPIDPDGHLCVRANGFRRRNP